jgi:hypothetical protein
MIRRSRDRVRVPCPGNGAAPVPACRVVRSVEAASVPSGTSFHETGGGFDYSVQEFRHVGGELGVMLEQEPVG